MGKVQDSTRGKKRVTGKRTYESEASIVHRNTDGKSIFPGARVIASESLLDLVEL